MSPHAHDCDCAEVCRPQEDCAGCGDGCNPAILSEAERLCWACVTRRNEIQAAMEDDERPANTKDARVNTLKPAIHYAMPRAAYDALPGENWSRLKALGKSAAHYLHEQTEERADTNAMRLGRATHTAVLEPEKFGAEYAVWEGARKQGKEWEAFRLEHAGREVLSRDERATCEAIRDAVHGDHNSARYFASGHAEVSLQWEVTTPSGLVFQCKGRIDFLSDLGAIADLKTTRDASPEGFGREAWRLGYYAQAAFYSDGHEAVTGERLPFVLGVAESAAPHVVQVYRVTEDVLALGREHYLNLLERLAFCRSEGRFPGYADEELALSLPSWAMPREDEEDLSELGLGFAEEAS